MIGFDSNCCVGKRGLKHKLDLWKTEDVLDVMDQCGVSAALAYSGWSKDYGAKYGNERLVEELNKSPRLYGCYTVVPNRYGDFYDAAGMIKDMKEKNMVAARMFPNAHRFSLDDAMTSYFNALETEGIPLLLDMAETSLSQVGSVASAHPNLNVLLQGVNWASEYAVHPYLARCPNLFLDFSVLQTNFAVERLVKTYGADRFVLGSGMPKMSLGAARSFIDYARISNEDKQKLLGGTLSRLCKVSLPDAVPLKNDEIAEEASKGKPLSVFVFDSHTHFLEDGGHGGGGLPMPLGDLDHMDALYEKLGVDRYAVAPWLGIWTDSEAGNNVMYDMMQRKPGKAYGYVLIDPNYVDDIEGEAKKWHVDKRVPGMKMFYARTQIRYNDPVYDPWWQIAEENRLFALLDYGGYSGYLRDVEELAVRYPNVSFFLDHAGRDFNGAVSNAAYAKKHPNIYLQITYTSVTQGVMEYFVKEGLADKVLYGTDAPMRDPRPQLGWVVFANIKKEDKEKILGKNMAGILARCFTKGQP